MAFCMSTSFAIPESKKPRKIAIGSGKPAQVIDAKAA